MGAVNHLRTFQSHFAGPDGSFNWQEYHAGGFTPPHVRVAIAQRERGIAAMKPQVVRRPHLDAINTAFAEIQERCGNRADRRLAEQRIAGYLRDQVLPHVHADDNDAQRLLRLPGDLCDCRKSGPWGRASNAETVIAWDAKCGQLLLCPDEAREEQKRLAETYHPRLKQLIADGYRIQKAVFTMPNFARGQLQLGQRKIFRRFRALLRQRRNGEQRFPIAGALAIIEAPLSSLGDWNVHLNVIMAIEPGAFLDWQQLREAWHWQIEISDWRDMVETTKRRMLRRGDNLEGFSDDDVLAHALLEVIKYPVQTVAEKADKQQGEWHGPRYQNAHGRPIAPPLTDWPGAAFLEWYRANKGFRRTRGYGKGVLFGFAKPERETIDLDQVEWLGQVRFTGRGYLVSIAPIDLIPGDKSPKVDDDAAAQSDKSRRAIVVHPPPDDQTLHERLEQEIFDDSLTDFGL